MFATDDAKVNITARISYRDGDFKELDLGDNEFYLIIEGEIDESCENAYATISTAFDSIEDVVFTSDELFRDVWIENTLSVKTFNYSSTAYCPAQYKLYV
jgi:hypothetical protein